MARSVFPNSDFQLAVPIITLEQSDNAPGQMRFIGSVVTSAAVP